MQVDDETMSYTIATLHNDQVKVMKVELDAIESNQTWNHVELPPNHKPMD